MSLVTDTMGQNIYDKQKVKTLSVPKTVVEDQVVTNSFEDKTYEQTMNSPAPANAQQLEDGTAEGVIQHIKAAAETEGSTNEIIELKDEVEKLRSLLFNLCTIFVNWVPISMDGGASLKAAISSTAATGVSDMAAVQAILQTFNYNAMDKNII